MYITGIILLLYFVKKRSPKFGIQKESIENFVFMCFLCALVGARAYYVLFNFDSYRGDLTEVFKIWHGGLAIHGGILGGMIFAFCYVAVKKIKLFLISDLVLPFLLIAQALGRIGNFANGEIHGFPVYTPPSIIFNLHKSRFAEFWEKTLDTFHLGNTPHAVSRLKDIIAEKGYALVNFDGKEYVLKKYVTWGISFPAKYNSPAYREFGTLPVHPAFFYELILNLIFGLFLVYLWRKDSYMGRGVITALYFVSYAVSRVVSSLFRAEDLMIGSMRAPFVASLVMLLIAAVVYSFALKSKPSEIVSE